MIEKIGVIGGLDLPETTEHSRTNLTVCCKADTVN